jgi:hypothetical protein
MCEGNSGALITIALPSEIQTLSFNTPTQVRYLIMINAGVP